METTPNLIKLQLPRVCLPDEFVPCASGRFSIYGESWKEAISRLFQREQNYHDLLGLLQEVIKTNFTLL